MADVEKPGGSKKNKQKHCVYSLSFMFIMALVCCCCFFSFFVPIQVDG